MAGNESCCIAAGWLGTKSGWKQHATRGQPMSCQKSKEGMIVVSIVNLGCVCLVFFQFEDFRVKIFVGRQSHLQDDILGERSSLGKCGKTYEN